MKGLAHAADDDLPPRRNTSLLGDNASFHRRLACSPTVGRWSGLFSSISPFTPGPLLPKPSELHGCAERDALSFSQWLVSSDSTNHHHYHAGSPTAQTQTWHASAIPPLSTCSLRNPVSGDLSPAFCLCGDLTRVGNIAGGQQGGGVRSHID